MVILIVVAFSYCKKEEPQSQTNELKPVIVQMEVVNTGGYSIFYDQQLVR
jgi:hypothetical protein